MGFLNKVKEKLSQGVGKYKEWEAKAPERQAAELKRLKEQEKKLKVQASIANQKQKLRNLQRQSIGDNPFLGGGMFGGSPFGDQPVKRSGSAKPKKRKSGSPKRKEVFYY